MIDNEQDSSSPVAQTMTEQKVYDDYVIVHELDRAMEYIEPETPTFREMPWYEWTGFSAFEKFLAQLPVLSMFMRYKSDNEIHHENPEFEG